MKHLFNHFFEKKSNITYIFAAYHPVEIHTATLPDTYSLNLLEAENQADEMSIDNIYQSL